MYLSRPIQPTNSAQSKSMNSETYLNHPTFGLLYRVCLIEGTRELFATLYAQRLFFLVTVEHGSIRFDPIGRTDARLLVENRLRLIRRNGQAQDYEQLQATYKITFH